MSEDKILAEWYTNERSRYEGLSNIVHYLIESLIKNAQIDYLSVNSRTKTVESFLEKTNRKSYSKPEAEITDLSGIRVITFIDSDVEKVGKLIRDSFKIHTKKSLDKTDELGIDRFGYRSLHFICDLGNDRIKLPEFSLYKGLLFEVQVRTALQHAWAEIEHDRNYKFSGTLPGHIQRRLHLLAGALELVDREFVSIANDIDNYAEEIAKKTKKGELNVELNTTSITSYLSQKIKPSLAKQIIKDPGVRRFNKVIEEFQNFGISTLNELDEILSDEFFDAIEQTKLQGVTEVGFLRRAMMFKDIDLYFDKAWKEHFPSLSVPTKEFLVKNTVS